MESDTNKKLGLYVLVVLYSDKPSRSNTLKSLKNINLEEIGIKPKIILWDNSPTGLYEEKYLNSYPHEFEYIHSPENKPLSSLYNIVVSSFIRDLSYEWMIFLDDDTNITREYFSELINEACQESVNLILPLVTDITGNLISPGKLRFVAGRPLHATEIYSGLRQSNKYLALMSAIAIHKNTFIEGVLFDENIPFYGIDTKFLLDYQEKFPLLYFMKNKIIHDSRLDDLKCEHFEDNYKRLSLLITSWGRSLKLTLLMKLCLFLYIPLFVVKKIIILKDYRYVGLIKLVFSVFNK